MNSKYETLVTVLDKLRYEAPQEYKKYYPKDNDIEKLNQSRSRAYIHLFLKVKFGLLDFLDRENLITDQSNDAGIDAYYIDKDIKTIYYIQSKFRTNEINFEQKYIELEEILAMDIDRVSEGETTNEKGISYNGKILQLIREISDIQDIGKYSHKAIILANLNKKITSTDLKKLTGGFSSDQYNFEKCYNELIYPLINGTFYNVDELFISLNLSEKTSDEISYSVKTEYGNCDITVVFVPIKEIAIIMNKYKNSILKFNPRSYLELQNNSVNRAIADTVKKNKTNEFALFNNGITMISDKTHISKNIGKKDQAQMVITNPQIINGGQTAYTLSRLYHETLIKGDQDDIFTNKEVIIKIITLSDDYKMSEKKKRKLIEEISKATNQQSPVLEADRRSNDDIQIEIQQKIYNEFGYFYERKKGEFGDGVHYKYIDRKQIINRVDFLRLCIAVQGDPTTARRAGERVLFKQDKFDKILNDSTRYKEYFFAYLLMNKLNELQRTFKSIPNNKDGIIHYGHALRYGKYSVISVTIAYFSDTLDTNEYQEKANNLLLFVLNFWLKFEAHIIKQSHNILYFTEIKDTENNEIRQISDFDGYYKGRTLNKDILNFFKEIKYVENITEN